MTTYNDSEMLILLNDTAAWWRARLAGVPEDGQPELTAAATVPNMAIVIGGNEPCTVDLEGACCQKHADELVQEKRVELNAQWVLMINRVTQTSGVMAFDGSLLETGNARHGLLVSLQENGEPKPVAARFVEVSDSEVGEVEKVPCAGGWGWGMPPKFPEVANQ